MTTEQTHGALHPSTSRRCTAHSSRTGDPCKKYAINGSNVCGTHGGKAPQVVAKAQQRLREAADRMATRLLCMAENENVPAYVALQAINSALDRAGVSEQKQIGITHELKPFEQMLSDAALEGGSRADYRASIGRPDPEQPAIETHHRPGGEPDVRVLGELPDGSLVIDGDVAGDDQDGPEHASVADDPGTGSESPKQTLANYAQTVRLPGGGYRPADDAMEQAAEANRNHRRQLRRR